MASKANWIEKMRCCLIADRNQCAAKLEETVEAALRGGVRSVQLRQKDAPTRDLYELARSLRALTRRFDALLLINDRADVALAVEADGVHLGWQSMPAAEVRKLGGNGIRAVAGRTLLIGRSVHNVGEAQQAAADGVDYLFAGPVFDTPSKAGLIPTLGPAGLREIRARIDLPVIGLGGIDPSNASSVVKAGADGIAVIRAILGASDPAQAAAKLLSTAFPGGQTHSRR